MNQDQVEGNGKQFSSSIGKNWGKLTDDDMQKAEGSRETLEGVIEERDGRSKEEAKRQVDTFLSSSTGTLERRRWKITHRRTSFYEWSFRSKP